jgi:hypothetical protein
MKLDTNLWSFWEPTPLCYPKHGLTLHTHPFYLYMQIPRNDGLVLSDINDVSLLIFHRDV